MPTHKLPTLLRVEAVDRYPAWSWLALAAAVVTPALAVLGIPPVDVHSPLHYLGIMDPLCGGTRAWYLSTQGRFGDALHYNPVAPLLLAATVVMVMRFAVGRLSGKWLTLASQIPKPVLIAVASVLVALLWFRQQLNADLLMDPWTG